MTLPALLVFGLVTAMAAATMWFVTVAVASAWQIRNRPVWRCMDCKRWFLAGNVPHWIRPVGRFVGHGTCMPCHDRRIAEIEQLRATLLGSEEAGVNVLKQNTRCWTYYQGHPLGFRVVSVTHSMTTAGRTSEVIAWSDWLPGGGVTWLGTVEEFNRIFRHQNQTT